MSHEPECPLVTDAVEGPTHLYECPCDLLRAAYTRGRDYEHMRLTNHDRHSGLACWTNYDAGYRKGYTDGYNDHARAAQHWQDTHGAYRQHGAGENP